jgi:hypothetical protein
MKAQFNSLENLAKCPVCDNAKGSLKTMVIKEEEGKVTFHVTCSRCNSSSLVFVSMSKLGIVSLGMLTDINGTEAKNFLVQDAISADCVIEVHEFLKNFQGGTKEFI